MRHRRRQTKTVLGILVLGWLGMLPNASADNIRFKPDGMPIIEFAGADENDVAKPEELRKSGTPMVPAVPSATSREVTNPDPTPAPAAANPRKREAGSATASDDKTAPGAATQMTAPTDGPGREKPADSGKTESPRFYYRVDGGYGFTSDSDGSGRNGANQSTGIGNALLLGAGGGAEIARNVRLEVSMTYRSKMDIDGRDGAGSAVNGDVQGVSSMLNLYYDVSNAAASFNGTAIMPYVGGGVGVSMLSSDDLETTGSAREGGDTAYNFAYALMAGVATKITENVKLDVGYRFINLGEFQHDGSLSTETSGTATSYDELMTHEVRAGLRISF